jgi:DNA-binding NarL/FixJ family response regulator
MLLQTIRAVAAGEIVVTPLMARMILDEYRHQQSDPRVSNGLTHLQAADQELLSLTMQGMPPTAITAQLGLNEVSIRQRLSLIAAKLHAQGG